MPEEVNTRVVGITMGASSCIRPTHTVGDNNSHQIESNIFANACFTRYVHEGREGVRERMANCTLSD